MCVYRQPRPRVPVECLWCACGVHVFVFYHQEQERQMFSITRNSTDYYFGKKDHKMTRTSIYTLQRVIIHHLEEVWF